MVWDRIDHPDSERVERWGGISYSLAAAAAAAPDAWSLRPLIKVGVDRAAEARAFLASLPVDTLDGVIEVPEATNHVHLRYRDRHHREEVLSGGVPAWRWAELEPHLHGLDALYVNLISGVELETEMASRLRPAIVGPVYADLHSLLLGVATDGRRVPRPLRDRDAWLGAFDVIQVNEEELAILAATDDPADLARRIVRSRGATVLVTRGPHGATWYAPGDIAHPWKSRAAAVVDGHVATPPPPAVGDPTGCGDVWGITCFIGLLGGARLTVAMDAANRAAGLKLSHRGADGLYDHLRNQT